MNSVFADTAAGHNNHVARHYFFGMGGLAVEPCGHDAGRAAINQGFAKKAVIKDNAAVDRGNTAFIAAVFDAFADAFVNAARMKNPGRQLLFIKR